MSDAEEQNKGFKITDRRSFTRDGERIVRAEAEEPPSSSKEAAAPEPERVVPDRSERPEREVDSRRRSRTGGLEAGFLDLLSFLATQASLALGAAHPMTGERHEDLEMARVMISMIEVLSSKTKGNLLRDEQAAIDEILYQLRMDFMAKAKVVKT
jgi:hypothetical protein